MFSTKKRPLPPRPPKNAYTSLSIKTTILSKNLVKDRLSINLKLAASLKTSEEVCILHLIVYWCLKNEINKHPSYLRNKFYWTHFSEKKIQEQYFPFISKAKITSAVKRLKFNRFIFVEQLPHYSCIRSNWYRPNFEKLTALGFTKNNLIEFFYLNRSK